MILENKQAIKNVFGVGLALAFTGCMMGFFGCRQFGAFDASALIDVGYRLFLEQRPYLDFFQNTPPLFALGAKYAFKWFGVRWVSLVGISVIWAFLVFLVQLTILRRVGLSFSYCLGIALLSVALAFFPLSYWWYNPVTSSVSTLLFSSALSLLAQKQPPKLDFAIFGVILTLEGLCKPNAAALSIFFCVVALLLKSTNRKLTVLVSCASAIAGILILKLSGFNPLDMLESYTRVLSRASPSASRFYQDQSLLLRSVSVLMIVLISTVFFQSVDLLNGESSLFRKTKKLYADWVAYFLVLSGFFLFQASIFILGIAFLFMIALRGKGLKIMIPLAVAAALSILLTILFNASEWLLVALWGLGFVAENLRRSSFELPSKILLFGIFSCAFFCFFSNGEHKTTDLPILLVPVFAMVELRSPSQNNKKNRLFRKGVLVLVSLVVLITTVRRDRIRSIGVFFSRTGVVDLGGEAPFFEGLRASSTMRDVIVNMKDFFQGRRGAFNPDKVFFGPRLEFAYAAFGISPPKEMPSWWAPGVTFSAAEQGQMEERFFEKDFDLSIFLNDDFRQVSKGFKERLESAYHQKKEGNIIVYSKKRGLLFRELKSFDKAK